MTSVTLDDGERIASDVVVSNAFTRRTHRGAAAGHPLRLLPGQRAQDRCRRDPGIHRKTVGHRLRRVEDLIGPGFHSRAADLHAALVIQRPVGLTLDGDR